jgi:hypothetical protein
MIARIPNKLRHKTQPCLDDPERPRQTEKGCNNDVQGVYDYFAAVAHNTGRHQVIEKQCRKHQMDQRGKEEALWSRRNTAATHPLISGATGHPEHREMPQEMNSQDGKAYDPQQGRPECQSDTRVSQEKAVPEKR